MKRSKAVLLLLIPFTLLGVAPSFAAPCAPRGVVFGFPYYDHIANGEPTSTSCWTLNHFIFVSGLPACSLEGPTYNAFQLDNFNGSVVQQFTIPSSMLGTQLDLVFSLDLFGFPATSFDAFQANVEDVTAGRSLASTAYFGDMGDTRCKSFDLQIQANPNETFAGHTIQVLFSAQRGSRTNVVRVHDIAFFQNIPTSPN